MRTVFADTGYWIASSNPLDQLHEKSKTVTRQLGQCRIVTTQMVLVEFLNFMGSRGEQMRALALTVVRGIAQRPDIEIVPQSGDQFQSAVNLYSSRIDKRWSVTDCASFSTMEDMNITEALAHDRHFEQTGFIALL